jgi:hypothetical protein
MPAGVYKRAAREPGVVAKPTQKRADRAAAATRTALEKEASRLEGAVNTLGMDLKRAGDELARVRALLRQLDAFLNPASGATAPEAAGGGGAPPTRQIGGPIPGEPAGMQDVITWVRGQGHELDVIEPGRRYKLNRILATRDDVIAAANRSRKQHRLPEFRTP